MVTSWHRPSSGSLPANQVEETLDDQEDDGTVTMPEDDEIVDTDAEDIPDDTETTDPSQVDPSTLPGDADHRVPGQPPGGIHHVRGG